MTKVMDDYCLESYTEAMRPADQPAAHLQFHLRHEVIYLEFLSHLFTKVGSSFVQEWVNAEPTGQYARRAAFLYEWLTGDLLSVPERLGGNYVDILDSKKVIAASPEHSVKNKRWRVNDNLPGTLYFCPLVLNSETITAAMNINVSGMLNDLNIEFGEDLIRRAAIWLTLRESKSSFAIEGETDNASRIERFADTMVRRIGQGELPLSDSTLEQLQADILGPRTSLTRFGVRQSPVFVGESHRYQEVVHYVAPPADDAALMLQGLQVFLERTQGQSSIMRAAVLAFGFVYIHPLADGNGRVHRFLINDILRRDGIIPAPVILPISAVITENPSEQLNYASVLDEISKPLMQDVRESLHFSTQYTSYPDGVVSNLEFKGNSRARPIWRYPNLGTHVLFLSRIIQRTITEEMREQSRYLRRHLRARELIKEVVEMPDQQVDRIIRSIDNNRGELSNVLAKEMPILKQDGIWSEIVNAVIRAE